MSPHPSAARCINETAKVMREAGVKAGLPADAIGCMTHGDDRRHRSADEAQADRGDPGDWGHRFGAGSVFIGQAGIWGGSGNVPVFIERTADVPQSCAGYSDRQMF